MFNNKKHARIIAVTVVAFFLLGIVGIVVSQSGNIYAAPTSKIGKVNRDRLFSEHPETATVQTKMNTEMAQAQKDFDEKTQNMNDQQKQDYYNQITERLAVTERDLIAPIQSKIDAAIKTAADAKGLEVVFDYRMIYYGGTDITEDVLKEIKK